MMMPMNPVRRPYLVSSKIREKAKTSRIFERSLSEQDIGDSSSHDEYTTSRNSCKNEFGALKYHEVSSQMDSDK